MGNCRCPHHKVIGAFIFLFGLMFLLHTMGVLSDMFVNYGWPILVMLGGLHKLIEGKCSCCGGKMMMGKTGKGMGMGKACGCEGECGCGDKGHEHA